MTAATLDPTRSTRGAELLAGTGQLLRLGLRRDRVRLAAWLLGVAGLTVYAAAALDTTYPTAADRQARGEVRSNPAAVRLSGPGYGLDNYTLGAMVANEVALTGIRPDRSIFAGKRYAPVSLVQYGRGCRLSCDFCSIHESRPRSTSLTSFS